MRILVEGVNAVWMFCRSCGYRGQFVAEAELEVECPDCHKHGRPKAIMVRQDVEWTKVGEG